MEVGPKIGDFIAEILRFGKAKYQLRSLSQNFIFIHNGELHFTDSKKFEEMP